MGLAVKPISCRYVLLTKLSMMTMTAVASVPTVPPVRAVVIPLGLLEMLAPMIMLAEPDVLRRMMRASDVAMSGMSAPNARPVMPAIAPIPTAVAIPTIVPIPARSPGTPAYPAPRIGISNIIPIVAQIAGVGRQELVQAHQSIFVGVHPPEESRRTLLVLDPRGGEEFVQCQETVAVCVEQMKHLSWR